MRLLTSFLALFVGAAAAHADQPVRARLKEGKWKEYPTRRLSDLPDRPTTAPALDPYGGWKTDHAYPATGFFHTLKIVDRWWLIDPAGNPFLNIAANSVSPGHTSVAADGTLTTRFSPRVDKSFHATFTSLDDWRDKTAAILHDYGFNGTGSWSADALLKPTSHRLAYTPNLGFMSSYGEKRGGTTVEPGHKGYPNDCIFAFDPEFAPFCDARAASLTANKDDPYLLGYFTDNELPMPKDSLDKYLALPAADPGHQAADAWLAGRPITDDLREAWRGHVADTYFGVVTHALRKHDPNHLVLGSRFYGNERGSAAVFKAAGKHLDVISVNTYNTWNPAESMRRYSEWAGKPILVTEWYAKGDDSGMANTTGAGWTVPTQSDRAAFYQHFALQLIESKSCVGWHWFKYADNDPTDPRPDPSNQDSNKGIVSADFKPYATLLDAMRDLNVVAYPLTTYFDAKR